jgi:hypothetical protein
MTLITGIAVLHLDITDTCNRSRNGARAVGKPSRTKQDVPAQAGGDMPKFSRRVQTVVAFLGGMVAAAWLVPAESKATFTQIVVHNSTRSQADFINDAGSVAGHYDGDGGQPAFLREADGTLTTFSAPEAFSTIPTGLNAAGAVSGFFMLPTDETHAFVRDPAGTLTVFDPPADGSFTIGPINRKGEIVGSFKDGNASFIRHANGKFTTFHVHGAQFGTLAVAINNGGDVAGTYTDAQVVQHGFLRARDGTIVKFDPPCGGTFDNKTRVVAINRGGTIAGQCEMSNGLQGYVRAPDGGFTVFQAPTGGKFPSVHALNDEGAVTGCYYDPANDLEHGFIRRLDGKMIVFDVPDHASTLMCTQSINKSGQVAGYAFTHSGDAEVGFIRTP